MIGGSHFRGQTDASRKASTIGPAMARSSRIACTRSMPNRRNTPATMAITIGIGTAAMARRTHPESPSTSMSSPVAKKAPTTSAKLRWPSAGPTSTVPGIVQKNASGCRYSQQASTVSRPLRKNTPKIQDASSAGERRPAVPTARITATGPVAEKIMPIRPLAA